MKNVFKNKKVNYYCLLIGFVTLVSTSITMLWTFFYALLNPSKSVLITLNTFGLQEWMFEAPLLFFSIPFVFYTIRYIKNSLDDIREDAHTDHVNLFLPTSVKEGKDETPMH